MISTDKITCSLEDLHKLLSSIGYYSHKTTAQQKEFKGLRAAVIRDYRRVTGASKEYAERQLGRILP